MNTKRVYAVIMIAMVLALLIGFLVLQQGPRLRRTAVTRSAPMAHLPRITLQLNESVERVTLKQVVVTPGIAHTVSSSNDRITIQFAEKPYWNEQYRIELRDVASQRTGRKSTIIYTLPSLTDSGLFYSGPAMLIY